MGIFQAIRGRDDNGRFTRTLVDTQRLSELEDKSAQTAASADNNAETSKPEGPELHGAVHNSESSQWINGIDDDEKEIDRNPGHVTDEACFGQQKAEAAALVWSRPVVFLIYAW